MTDYWWWRWRKTRNMPHSISKWTASDTFKMTPSLKKLSTLFYKQRYKEYPIPFSPFRRCTSIVKALFRMKACTGATAFSRANNRLDNDDRPSANRKSLEGFTLRVESSSNVTAMTHFESRWRKRALTRLPLRGTVQGQTTGWPELEIGENRSGVFQKYPF